MPKRFRVPFPAKVLGLIAFSPWLSASVLNGELRHHSETTQRNVTDQTLIFRSSENDGVFLAARLQQIFESVQYAAGYTYAPLPFFLLHTRLSHVAYLNEGTSLTHLLGTATVKIPGPFSPFVTAGWYKRWALLEKMSILPTFRSSYTEHDFALALGFLIHWNPQFGTEIRLSTFEDIEVFNLNNPYAQIKMIFTPKDMLSWYFFGRYKVLLGFGQLDAFAVGAGIQFKI